MQDPVPETLQAMPTLCGLGMASKFYQGCADPDALLPFLALEGSEEFEDN